MRCRAKAFPGSQGSPKMDSCDTIYQAKFSELRWIPKQLLLVSCPDTLQKPVANSPDDKKEAKWPPGPHIKVRRQPALDTTWTFVPFH